MGPRHPSFLLYVLDIEDYLGCHWWRACPRYGCGLRSRPPYTPTSHDGTSNGCKATWPQRM